MPIIDGLEMISLILIVVCFLFQCVSSILYFYVSDGLCLCMFVYMITL